MNTTHLITSDEAAKILGVTPVRVNQFARNKRIKVVKVLGRSNLFDRREVQKFKRIPRKHGRPPESGK